VVRIDTPVMRSPRRGSHRRIAAKPTARGLTPAFTRREFGREDDE